MLDNSIKKTNKEKLNYINLFKFSNNYKMITQSSYVDLILKYACDGY